MGQNYSSGQTAVNGTVTTVGTFTPTKKTVVSAQAYSVVNTTTTLGTVPANKVWRIIGANLCGSCITAQVESNIQANGVKILIGSCIGGATWTPWTTSGLNLGYSEAIVIVATQTVTIQSAGAGAMATGGVCYIEEDA